MEKINLICDHCDKSFYRKKSQHNRSINRGQKRNYCNRSCARDGSKLQKTIYICLNCSNEFSRLKGKSDTCTFCCQSCAAIYNNKSRIKPKISKTCEQCPTEINHGGKYCDSCRFERRYNKRPDDYNNITLKELKEKYSSHQYHAKIRGRSRLEWKKNKMPMVCAYCLYDRHVDICHIKDLKSFSLETPLHVANSIDNLISLCKNHHWEFDNGYLSMDDIK